MLLSSYSAISTCASAAVAGGKLFVGTMTNTAEYVAQAIEMDCADLVDQIEVTPMDGLDISVFDEDALYLICSSTYGSGDVPDNARALYDSMDSAPKYLGHVRYGVIALGDRTYQQTFCFGGKKFSISAKYKARDIGICRCGPGVMPPYGYPVGKSGADLPSQTFQTLCCAVAC
jgi:flavodoxin